MNSLHSQQIQREIARKTLENPSSNIDFQDFVFQKIKKQAKEEVSTNALRLIFRNKYNLPPNDPRFLDMTDEEIVYDIILQNEYSKWASSNASDSSIDNTETFQSNEEEFEEINKRLEAGEDIDLNSLRPESSWEKI